MAKQIQKQKKSKKTEDEEPDKRTPSGKKVLPY